MTEQQPNLPLNTALTDPSLVPPGSDLAEAIQTHKGRMHTVASDPGRALPPTVRRALLREAHNTTAHDFGTYPVAVPMTERNPDGSIVQNPDGKPAVTYHRGAPHEAFALDALAHPYPDATQVILQTTDGLTYRIRRSERTGEEPAYDVLSDRDVVHGAEPEPIDPATLQGIVIAVGAPLRLGLDPEIGEGFSSEGDVEEIFSINTGPYGLLSEPEAFPVVDATQRLGEAAALARDPIKLMGYLALGNAYLEGIESVDRAEHEARQADALAVVQAHISRLTHDPRLHTQQSRQLLEEVAQNTQAGNMADVDHIVTIMDAVKHEAVDIARRQQEMGRNPDEPEEQIARGMVAVGDLMDALTDFTGQAPAPSHPGLPIAARQYALMDALSNKKENVVPFAEYLQRLGARNNDPTVYMVGII